MGDLYRGKTVLIAGGTRGIGLACGVEFAKQGATVWLTHCWSSVSDEEVIAHFQKQGALTEPLIMKADVCDSDDTMRLLSEIKKHTNKIDAFVCCAGNLKRIESLKDYSKRSFLKTMEFMAWPIVDYSLMIDEVFGVYPKYIVGMTTYSTVAFNNYYDFAAAAKASVETLIRYMAVRLEPLGSRINLVRPPLVDTKALEIFGDSKVQQMKTLLPAGLQMKPEEIGRAVFGLCSGYLDTFNGQILNLDNGSMFVDNSLGLIERKDFQEVVQRLSGK